MKNITLALLLVVSVTACRQQPAQKTENNGRPITEAIDTNIVNVYYFHGKQRCKTCIAVGEIAKETVGKAYAGNSNVYFTEINTSEPGSEALVEKYEVTWNALIIARGGNSVEITRQAFATAAENPQALENLIRDEVNKRLH